MANQLPKRINHAMPDTAGIIYNAWTENAQIHDVVTQCQELGAKLITEEIVEGMYAELDERFSTPLWTGFMEQLKQLS